VIHITAPSRTRCKTHSVNAGPHELSEALDRSEFFPCFQPIVELRTGHLHGFEVLARWQHPQRGLVLPDHFISLAEQSGLISRLMQQVVSKAFKSARLLPAPLSLAVNVSPVQLHDLTLPGQIRTLSEESGFPLGRLHIEITESSLIDNINRAKQITLELKALGCRLAMDDFGQGYSSLRHLHGMPFDRLKVDRSFVASMIEERESRKIVAAVIGLGHTLGLVTVGEGVETEQQAEMLRLLGCDMVQGWLYGKPLPADSIPEMVTATSRMPSPRFAKKEGGVSSLEALPTQHLSQLQAIYDGAPVGLCFLDENLRYVSLNRRLAEMNGAPAAKHIGRTMQEMLPKLFRDLEPHLRRALHGVALAEVEACLPANNWTKTERTILFSFQPAFDEAGDVIGVSVTAMEITQWKRVEWQRDSVTGSCTCATALQFSTI
jgi:EAL domain-containing protein (putative c-di-GMP-specific phosphodiesterase class I)